MIDLGVELAGYGQEPAQPAYTVADLHNMKVRLWTGGGANLVPLADLQAQGFNTTPPPGFRADYARRKFLNGWVQ